MGELQAPRGWWLVAAAAGAWSAIFLVGQWPAPVLAPLGFTLGCLVLWRLPVVGALLVCGTQAAGLVLGVEPDNAAGLLPALLTLVVLGLSVPVRTAVPLVAAFLGVILATGLSPVRTLVGLFLFTATWLVARRTGQRRHAVEMARTRAHEVEGQDVQEASARLLAAERRRLASRSVALVRAAVEDMARGARDARESLDPATLAGIRRRGEAAVAELRDLLGLLRSPADAVVAGEPAPPARSVWSVDVAVAVGMALVGAVDLALARDLDPGVVTALLGGLLYSVLAIRRTVPAVAVTAAAAVMVLSFVTQTPMLHGLAQTVTLALLTWTAVTAGGRAAAAVLLLLPATVAAATQRSLEHAAVAGSLLVLVAVAAHAWRRLTRDHDLAARRVAAWEGRLQEGVQGLLAEERSRIARDLHDVASHALGVMLLQAGAAEVLRVRDPRAARSALHAALDAGTDALRELDALGRVLERPVRGSFAAEVSALARRIAAGGVPVRVHELVDLEPGAAASAAYRVVQEGLTNAVKHAPGAAIDLTVGADPDGVRIEVRNGPGLAPSLGSGSRLGLSGLRERVSHVGGTLVAGPIDGGFLLSARFRVPTNEPAR